jgi:2-oxoglutarate dehydrogenase E2 component (dihydrolipoamide succinyltransferase)
MRKKVEHMVLSRRISAHVTTVYEIDMTKIAKLRDRTGKPFWSVPGRNLLFHAFYLQGRDRCNSQVPGF